MIVPLEIVSAHRNRIVYPNPFFFKVTFNNTGLQNTGITSTDPITLQLPIAVGKYDKISSLRPLLQWTGFTINVTGIIIDISDANVQIQFTSSFDQTPNHYRGLQCVFVGGYWSRITDYKYLGSNLGLVTLDKIPYLLPSIGSNVTISSNPTQTTTTLSVMFVPNTLPNMELVDLFCYNETILESRRIARYYQKNSQIILETPPLTLWSNTHTFSIRRELPFITSVVLSTANSITVSNGVEGFVPGDFIKNTSTNEIVLIIEINYTLQILTYSPSSSPWAIGTIVELLKFNSENSNFITYSSIQRESLTTEYEIELISLSIPKCILNNIFPSYKLSQVYVEFSDTSNPNINNFMSNNPGNRKALFKATPVSQLSGKNSKKPFIKFSGDGAKKNIKFRLSASSFIFAIRDIDGKVLSNVISDTLSPNPPNPLLQCEALFNVKLI